MEYKIVSEFLNEWRRTVSGEELRYVNICEQQFTKVDSLGIDKMVLGNQ